MYTYFGGVTPILVSDNCATAINRKQSDWYTPELNRTYYEFAEHYNVAILPARVRRPKDKPNVEGSVGKISTWITAALKNEQFFKQRHSGSRKKLQCPFVSKKGMQQAQSVSWGRKAITGTFACHTL